MTIGTLIVASLAVLASVFAAYLTRKTGRENVRAVTENVQVTHELATAAKLNADAAERASAASETSARAAVRSAAAAEDAVAVTRQTAEQVAEREASNAFAARYQNAASLLGDDSPAVKLAGLQTLVRLADEWPKNREHCLSLVTNYLRIGEELSGEEQQLRGAVLMLIADRLRATLGPVQHQWSTDTLDLRGTSLINFDIRGARLDSPFDLSRVRFLQHCCLDGVSVIGGLNLDLAVVARGAELSAENLTTERITANRLHVEAGASLSISPLSASEFQAESMQIDGELTLKVSDEEPRSGYKLSRLHIGMHGLVRVVAVAEELDQSLSEPRRVIISLAEARHRERLAVEPADLLTRGVVQLVP